MRVRDLIRKEVITIDSSSTLLDAADKMSRFNIGLLVVVEGGKPVGVISERDIVRAIADRIPLVVEVGGIATRNIVSVDADADVYEAVRLMRENWIRHLVVTEGGKVVGVISLRDLLADEVLASIAENLRARNPSRG